MRGKMAGMTGHFSLLTTVHLLIANLRVGGAG
jgi:hypothetical protein